MQNFSSQNFFAPLAADAHSDERSIYWYHVIPEASDLIRLMCLEPAPDWSYPLNGTLSAVSLTSPPAYKALSYVWGSEFEKADSVDSDGESDTKKVTDYESCHPLRQFPCEITLAGHTIKIGRNLYNALKRIRNSRQRTLVWADAICIDQLDVRERNHQVKLMTTIYTAADEVYVCFENEEAVYEYFEDVCPSIKKCAKYWRDWSSTPVDLRDVLMEPKSIFRVVDLLDTSWWNRAWTAQEFILGCNVKLYFFSDDSLTTEDLMDWISYLEDYDRLQAIGSIQDDNYERKALRSKRLVGRNIQSAYSNVLWWSADIKASLLLRQQMRDTPRLVSALDLVAFSRYRKASEVRDKIFAFLGLCPEMLDLVDYNLPVESCFEQFAVRTVASSNALDIFNHIIVLTIENNPFYRYYPYLASQKRHSFPSWVPDWTIDLKPEDYAALRMRARQLCCQQKVASVSSSMTYNSKPHFSYLGSGKLAVRGRLYSTISKVGVPYLSRSGSHSLALTRACIQDWLRLARDVGNPHLHDSNDLRVGHIKLHRTLTRGLSYQWMQHLNSDSSTPADTNNLGELDHELMRLFLRHFTHAEAGYTDLYARSSDRLGDGREHLLAKLDTFADFILDNAVLERFVVDGSGRFGFAPAAAQEGDAIVEFEGSKTLYVVSRCQQGQGNPKRRNRGKGKNKKKSGEPTETYKLLGPAYIGEDEAEDEALSGLASSFTDLGLNDCHSSAAHVAEVRDAVLRGEARDFVLV